jgi:hypothetical protein
MPPKPQCPFCLKRFNTVKELTRHLVYDKCRVDYGGKGKKKK